MEPSPILPYAKPNMHRGFFIEQTSDGVRVSFAPKSIEGVLIGSTVVGMLCLLGLLILRGEIEDLFTYGFRAETFGSILPPLTVVVCLSAAIALMVRAGFLQRRAPPAIVIDGQKLMVWEPAKHRAAREFPIDNKLLVRFRGMSTLLVFRVSAKLQIVRSGRVVYVAMYGKPWNDVLAVSQALSKGIEEARRAQVKEQDDSAKANG
jgi:hypothetical protein